MILHPERSTAIWNERTGWSRRSFVQRRSRHVVWNVSSGPGCGPIFGVTMMYFPPLRPVGKCPSATGVHKREGTREPVRWAPNGYSSLCIHTSHMFLSFVDIRRRTWSSQPGVSWCRQWISPAAGEPLEWRVAASGASFDRLKSAINTLTLWRYCHVGKKEKRTILTYTFHAGRPAKQITNGDDVMRSLWSIHWKCVCGQLVTKVTLGVVSRNGKKK